MEGDGFCWNYDGLGRTGTSKELHKVTIAIPLSKTRNTVCKLPGDLPGDLPISVSGVHSIHGSLVAMVEAFLDDKIRSTGVSPALLFLHNFISKSCDPDV